MLTEEIKKAKIEAMKAHDKNSVTAYNTLISKIMLLTVEKRAKGEVMTDADVVGLLQKTEKELIEEKESFAKAGREETVGELECQVKAIQKFMPTLLSEGEIKDIILALEDKSVPSVMKHFKLNYAGKCDMKVVSNVLRQI